MAACCDALTASQRRARRGGAPETPTGPSSRGLGPAPPSATSDPGCHAPFYPAFVPVGLIFFFLRGVVRPCTVPWGFGAGPPLLSKKNVLGAGRSPTVKVGASLGIPGGRPCSGPRHPSARPLPPARAQALPFTRSETEAAGALRTADV